MAYREDGKERYTSTPYEFNATGNSRRTANGRTALRFGGLGLGGDLLAHRLAELDEKSLKDLQGRLRKVREKNFSLLRREGAARVEAEGGRGSAEPANQKRNDKVDVIDQALARVSERLEAVGDGA